MCLFVCVCVCVCAVFSAISGIPAIRDLFAFDANIKVFLLMVQFFLFLLDLPRKEWWWVSVYVVEGSLIIEESVWRSLLIKQMDHEGGFFLEETMTQLVTLSTPGLTVGFVLFVGNFFVSSRIQTLD